MKKLRFYVLIMLLPSIFLIPFPSVSIAQEYLGNLSTNRFDPNSTSNLFGAGNPYNPNSINNQFGRYGSSFSDSSISNPFATDAPKLYDSQGCFASDGNGISLIEISYT